jgi:hypothetical protein
VHLPRVNQADFCLMTSSYTADTFISRLRDPLQQSRNPDGGWGYYSGKASRLEPTCWALLALGDEANPEALRRWPSVDGLLLEHAGGRPNFAFHGLALTTLLNRQIEHETGNAALVAGIQRVKGIAVEDLGHARQNNQIQAWSWTSDTFSWVEPTAYCLLALKQARRAGFAVDATRIGDAEALLFDRCCSGGGWNYGNANMLGKELLPYVPTTALSLLALQDRTSEAVFTRSREYLVKNAVSEQSPIALSLALIGLRTLGDSVAHIQAALERQLPTTLAFGNQLAAAVALCASRTDHRDAPFTF